MTALAEKLQPRQARPPQSGARRPIAKRPATLPRQSPDAIAAGVIEAVERKWDPGHAGPLAAPWLPTHYARPEAKLGYLVSLIDAHLKGLCAAWGISLNDPKRPTSLTIIRRRFREPQVLPVSFAGRVVSVGSASMSLAERGVAGRVLRQIAERVGLAVGVR